MNHKELANENKNPCFSPSAGLRADLTEKKLYGKIGVSARLNQLWDRYDHLCFIMRTNNDNSRRAGCV